MKIAFAVLGYDLTSLTHEKFGRAPRFLVFDTHNKQFTPVENPATDGAQGAGLKAAETVINSGSKAVVAGEFGPKAVDLLRSAQIAMHPIRPLTVREALQKLFGVSA